MGVIQVKISDEAEEMLRTHIRRKGDLGRLVEKALLKYFRGDCDETA